MRGALWALFRREVAVARRLGGGGLTGVSFMLALVIVVPFAVGPDLNLLRRIGPAMLWIAALLATLLGLDRLFQADLEDGEQDGRDERCLSDLCRRRDALGHPRRIIKAGAALS